MNQPSPSTTPQATNSITDLNAFTWSITGSKVILVTVTNALGTVTNTRIITVVSTPAQLDEWFGIIENDEPFNPHKLFIPIILKQYGT